MRLVIGFTIFILSSCATRGSIDPAVQIVEIPSPPIVVDLYTSQTEQPRRLNDIYLLTEVQKRNFFSAYNSVRYRNLLPNKRISRYIKEELSDFAFHWETLTASDAIATRTGNCLSMAIVTKALADLVNIEIRYELVASPPIYQKAGDVVLVTQHVRTFLLDPKQTLTKGFFTLWRGGVKIDYFPNGDSIRLRRVEDTEFQTMYYINKAAEALGENADALAFAHLQRNLQIDKTEPQTVNMLAVIHERAGKMEHAEKLYKYGLKYGGDSFVLLNNYHNLLVELNRVQEADEIAIRLRKYHDPNPYKWMELGHKEYAASNFSKAIFYYSKARELAHYLHEPYAGIAKAHYSLGNLSSAKRSLKKAIKNAQNQPVSDKYQQQYWQFFQETIDG